MEIQLNRIREIEKIKDWNNRVLAAATMYAEAGFYVVPIRPNGKALPGKRYNFDYMNATNKPDIVRAWYGQGGQFEGWNIGIATGRFDGTFVIDIDRDDEHDGFDTFNEIIPEDWSFSGPMQVTPSGGVHMVCKWRDNARSSTDKLGKHIDTRGGFPDRCGGHIVVWPSKINGKYYRWQEGGEVPDTPDWLIDRMGKPFIKGTGNRGNEFIDVDDAENILPIQTIEVMLEIIDPDELSYTEWLEVGQAIHSQHPTGEGLEVWDSWSKRGDRYQPNECQTRWRGFNAGGAIRMGTLIHYARQRGFQLMEIQDPNKDRIDEIVDQLNKTFAVVPMGSDILVLEECEVIPEMQAFQPKYRFWKKAGFRNFYENKLEVVADSHGKPVKKSHADIWLSHENRREYPAGVGLFPNKPQRHFGHFNLWQGFAIQPDPRGSWQLFKDHVVDIICNGDRLMAEWVFDWMADLVQDPGDPKGTAIVMSGIEGCGKGTFCTMLGKLFGTHYKHLTNEEHLIGRFNGHMVDAIFVFADEAVFGGDRKAAGKLKALVTEKIITGERKGIDAIQYKNCAHLAIASNESWFIPAGPQSRRWLVLAVSGEKANDRTYFNAIHKQMEQEGGLEAMLYDLMERKINSDLRVAPETKALQVQREMYGAIDSSYEWWFERLSLANLGVTSARADFADERWPKEVVKTDLLETYYEWCDRRNRRRTSPNKFYSFMLDAGLRKTRLAVNGGRVYGYKVPDHPSCEKIAQTRFGYNPDDGEDYED